MGFLRSYVRLNVISVRNFARNPVGFLKFTHSPSLIVKRATDEVSLAEAKENAEASTRMVRHIGETIEHLRQASMAMAECATGLYDSSIRMQEDHFGK